MPIFRSQRFYLFIWTILSSLFENEASFTLFLTLLIGCPTKIWKPIGKIFRIMEKDCSASNLFQNFYSIVSNSHIPGLFRWNPSYCGSKRRWRHQETGLPRPPSTHGGPSASPRCPPVRPPVDCCASRHAQSPDTSARAGAQVPRHARGVQLHRVQRAAQRRARGAGLAALAPGRPWSSTTSRPRCSCRRTPSPRPPRCSSSTRRSGSASGRGRERNE